MRLRPTAARSAAAAAALVVVLAGCGGGGGGGGDASADPNATAAVVAPAAGATPAPTDQLYGSPAVPEPGANSSSLPGYDEMGTPGDVFVPIVKDETSDSGNAPTAGAGPGAGTATSPGSTANPPVVTQPVTPVPVGVTPTPVPTTSTAPTAPGPAPAPSQAPAVQGYEADFDIGGEPVVARVGDAIPPDTQQFTVERVSLGSVVLKLNGGLLPDGSDTVTLKEGSSLTLVNQTSRVTYKLRLLEIRKI